MAFIHLGQLAPAFLPKQDAAIPGINGRAARSPIRLAPDWVYPASSVALRAVGSYSPFSPLSRVRGTVYFLRHFPSQQVSLLRPFFQKESCPVVSGLSSPLPGRTKRGSECLCFKDQPSRKPFPTGLATSIGKVNMAFHLSCKSYQSRTGIDNLSMN